MMKWRVQKKKLPLKEEEKKPLSGAPDSSLEEVKASLDYLDSIIEEYNDNSTPSPILGTKGNGIIARSPSPTSNNPTPVQSPSPIRKTSIEEEHGEDNNNISHVIIKDIITVHMSPPPVPRRGPRSCCRNREYPVSPPPRRRYTSPERRMKAALQNKTQESNLKRNPSAPASNQPAYQRHDTNNNVTPKIIDVKPNGLPPRVTVTFRTVSNPGHTSPPPAFSPVSSPVTFRRKTESRNSIHVDFNVKDLCGKEDNQIKTSEEGRFVRTRSLRGLRRTSDDEATRGSSVSPPPLPPRKSRDDVKRNGQGARHVTFCVDNEDSTLNGNVTLNGKKETELISHTDAAPQSPVQRIKLMPLAQERVEDKLRSADENGILIKTFEPSAVDDVPTDCYNVYNVRTGKISSSVLKPSLVARQTVKSPANNVSSPLERLRSISPTREAAEKFIGKIISKCKSTSPNNKGKKVVTDQHQSRLTKQQRHSRCTKCAVATGKCCSGVPMIKLARGT